MTVAAQLTLFFLNAVVLLLISAHLILFNYLLKFRSLLDNADALNNYWDKVRFHAMVPHRAAIVLCIITGTGVCNISRSFLATLLQFGDLLSVDEDLSYTGEYIVSCIATFVGSAAGASLYTIERGRKLKLFLVLQTLIVLLTDLVKLFGDTNVSVFAWILWITSFVSISVASISYVQKNSGVFDQFLLPPADDAILEEIQSMMPKQKNKRVFCREFGVALLAIVIYVVINFIHVLILNFVSRDQFAHYRLATLLTNLTELLPLLGCGLLVVFTINEYINKRIPLHLWVWVIFGIVNCCVIYQNMFEAAQRHLKKNETAMEVIFSQLLRNYFTYYTFGLFCGTIYLGICLKRVEKALGTGVENDSELVVLDEDDEDDEVHGVNTA